MTERHKSNNRINVLKKVLSCIICAALTLGCIGIASHILEYKKSRRQYDWLKENGEQLDVIYLGGSHVWEGIYPMDIYEDYGITGFNLGYSAYRIPMDYWILREAYEYSSPKLLVLDVYLLSETATANNDESLHTMLDAFPSNLLKYEALSSLGSTLEGPINKFDLMFDFCSYHGRWSDLEDEEFEGFDNVSKGASKVYDVYPYDGEIQSVPASNATSEYNISMEYLEKIIALAQSHDTKVLLVLVPQPCTAEAKEYYNWCYSLEDKYGVTYLDLTEVDGLIDYTTDLADFSSGSEREQNYIDKGQVAEGSVYDNSAHLNVSGATKLSAWLGSYINDHYELDDHRGQSGFENWDEDLILWKQNN